MQIPNPTNQQNRSIHHKIKALVTSGVESNKPDEMARLVETNHKEEEEEKTVKQKYGKKAHFTESCFHRNVFLILQKISIDAASQRILQQSKLFINRINRDW